MSPNQAPLASSPNQAQLCCSLSQSQDLNPFPRLLLLPSPPFITSGIISLSVHGRRIPLSLWFTLRFLLKFCPQDFFSGVFLTAREDLMAGDAHKQWVHIQCQFMDASLTQTPPAPSAWNHLLTTTSVQARRE